MNLEKLRNLNLPSTHQDYSFKDSILYALGLGYGENTTDSAQLQFVYEDNQKAVPSMCVVLAYPGFWLRDPELAADWKHMLHGEHYFEIHNPLKSSGSVRSEHCVPAVVDKGEGKGALVYIEKRLFDQSGAPLATIRQTMFLRGDGGCGSYGDAPSVAPALPERFPDDIVEIATIPQLALLYRLSGDFNPVHADSLVAKEAGFDRPILMGLCTMGLATRAAISLLCAGKPERLRSMFVRFSSPVFPGETIRFEFFREAGGARFRALSAQRNVVVLDRCDVRCEG